MQYNQINFNVFKFKTIILQPSVFPWPSVLHQFLRVEYSLEIGRARVEQGRLKSRERESRVDYRVENGRVKHSRIENNTVDEGIIE